MWRALTFVALTLGIGVSMAQAAPLPPEKAVTLDFEWLSPPVIAPDSAWGNIVRINDFVRLSSRPGTMQPRFTWSLRYPIDTSNYPVLVLRYRAGRIGTASEPVLAVELSDGEVVVPVANAAELSQDGSVQEFRKDLRPLPNSSAIGRVHFTLPPAVTRLDILELRFEPASDTPAAKVPMRRNMELAVVDEQNRPVTGATIVAGPLERANWTAVGRTDEQGRVSLAVISPAEEGQAAGILGLVQPVEAAIMRRGYAPQYLSNISVRPNEVFAVRLTRSGALPAGQPTEATASAPQPAEPALADSGSTTTIQNIYYYGDQDEYYDDAYGYRHRYTWANYWPGYVLVVRDKNDQHPGHGHGHHGKGGGKDGQVPDNRTPSVGLPAGAGQQASPWQPSPGVDVTAPRTRMLGAPSIGTGVASTGNATWGATTAGGQAVTTSSRFPILSAPTVEAKTIPTYEIEVATYPGMYVPQKFQRPSRRSTLQGDHRFDLRASDNPASVNPPSGARAEGRRSVDPVAMPPSSGASRPRPTISVPVPQSTGRPTATIAPQVPRAQ